MATLVDEGDIYFVTGFFGSALVSKGGVNDIILLMFNDSELVFLYLSEVKGVVQAFLRLVVKDFAKDGATT